MLKLYKTGSSFQEIARRLNQLDIPTKKNMKKWHHHVIAEIIR